MKLLELKKIIDYYLKDGNKNEELKVVVPIQGIGGPYSELKSCGIGFDWYHGKFCLFTDEILSNLDINKFFRLKILLLSKVSNYKKIQEQKLPPFTARYKTKTQEFDKRGEAIAWIFTELEDELNSKG